MSADYTRTIAKIDETIATFQSLLLVNLADAEREQVSQVIYELTGSRRELQAQMDAMDSR